MSTHTKKSETTKSKGIFLSMDVTPSQEAGLNARNDCDSYT
jgi:hypothetical protein